MRHWLVHFINAQSGWLVSQVHVIAADAESAAKAAAEKFGIDLTKEDAVTAHAQDWTDVAGPVETPETVQAETPDAPVWPEPVAAPDSPAPVIEDRTEAPAPVSTLPEILEHDAELLAADVEHEVGASPAGAEVAAALRALSPEAIALLKGLL